MRTIVKVDERGRVQLSTKIRKLLKLKSQQLVSLEVKGDAATLKKAEGLVPSKDKVLRDILVRPAYSKVKVTRALLDRLEDEVWSS